MDFVNSHRLCWRLQVRISERNSVDILETNPEVTVNPVIMRYKKLSENLSYQSFVFISHESRHDATFFFALIWKLITLLWEIAPDLEMIHNSTDPLVNIGTKLLSKWSVAMRSFFVARHQEKGPCHSIRETIKRKLDQKVKYGKYIIQDAVGFYVWSLLNICL